MSFVHQEMSTAKLAPAAAAAVTMTTTETTAAKAPQQTGSSSSGSQSQQQQQQQQQRLYGKIVLTLENCLLPEAKLELTPSQADGLDRETEIDLRILGCEMIQTAGILLKLPQVRISFPSWLGKISIVCNRFFSQLYDSGWPPS